LRSSPVANVRFLTIKAFICEQCYYAGSEARMDYDRDKVDDMVLALLCLTIWENDGGGASAWKSHDWDAMDRLHAKGHISDPRRKAKSVVLCPDGVDRAGCSSSTLAGSADRRQGAGGLARALEVLYGSLVRFRRFLRLECTKVLTPAPRILLS
jgi:hypothetical protein